MNMYGDWTTGFRFPTEAGLSVHHCVQTGSGAHLYSYTMGTGRGLPLVVKRPGREANHSSPSSAEVKNAWSYT